MLKKGGEASPSVDARDWGEYQKQGKRRRREMAERWNYFKRTKERTNVKHWKDCVVVVVFLLREVGTIVAREGTAPKTTLRLREKRWCWVRFRK